MYEFCIILCIYDRGDMIDLEGLVWVYQISQLILSVFFMWQKIYNIIRNEQQRNETVNNTLEINWEFDCLKQTWV